MANIVTTNVSNVPIKDKQLLIDPESGELYFDHGGARVKLGGSDAPVSSVNGKTGEVVLDAEDVQAAPEMRLKVWDPKVDGYFADQSLVADPGVYYVLGSNVTVDPIVIIPTTSLVETVIQITTPSDFVMEVMFPASVSWVNEPEFEPGKTYIISIVNDVAVVSEVTA